MARALDATLDPDNFPRLLRLAIRIISTTKHPEVVQRVISNPAVARLRELTLWGQFGPDEHRALLAAPALDSLDRIHVHEYSFGMTGEVRQKAITALRERFGPRYDSSA